MISAGVQQTIRMVALNMRRRQHTDYRHSRRAGALDTRRAVFNHQTVRRRHIHFRRRMQEDIRMRFAARHLGGAVDVGAEARRKIQDLKADLKAGR